VTARSTPATFGVVAGSAAFLVGQVLSTVLFATVGIALAPLPFRLRYRFITGWTRFNLWWLAATCRLRHRVSGAENIPAAPAVVLAKHESAWETLALQTLFVPQSWVLKRELLRIPFFGWGLALLRPIARATGREAVRQLIVQGRRRLVEGSWVVVFPEGTRMPPGVRGAYHKGGAVLAKRAGSVVVPIAHNAGDFWPRRSFLKWPGTIDLVVGPPIATADKSSEEVIERAADWIEATLRRIRAGGGP